MRFILERRIEPIQIGIFLIGLRMKRETDDENLGVLDALADATDTVEAPVDDVVTLTDPFNGYNRILPSSPFLPAVLAACGVPTVSQGLESVGPKFGITHHRVLRAAGARLDTTPAQAAERLAGPGWAYVDQSVYSPGTHSLVDLRTQMVKRTAVTTAEVIPTCVKGRRGSHLVTGYVHKPYPRIYALLARNWGYDSCLLVRGVEGGIIPSLRQKATMYRYAGEGELEAVDTDPVELGIEQKIRAVSLPEAKEKDKAPSDDVTRPFDAEAGAAEAARLGLAALGGEPGPTRDGLVYGAALVLYHLGRQGSLAEAAGAARAAIDSGEARRRFDAP
jgi:anthranilate phosphoribosyltransferase